jgi:hypothetical protein
MASTFTTANGTLTFVATTDSWSEAKSAEVNVLGFPGGNDVAISIAGQRETRRTFKAMLDDLADYRLFTDMLGQAGWLYVENWDAAEVRAVLVRVAPDPVWQSGEVTCSAQFILY